MLSDMARGYIAGIVIFLCCIAALFLFWRGKRG